MQEGEAARRPLPQENWIVPPDQVSGSNLYIFLFLLVTDGWCGLNFCCLVGVLLLFRVITALEKLMNTLISSMN